MNKLLKCISIILLFFSCEEKIIEKAKNTKTIVEVTKNDDYEYEIWKNILQLRVIKLEDISLKITKLTNIIINCSNKLKKIWVMKI